MTVNITVFVSPPQAARQAAREKKAEVSQAAAPPPPAAEAPPESSVLPVGNSMHVHVDYDYFEVGTGQVTVKADVEADLEFELID